MYQKMQAILKHFNKDKLMMYVEGGLPGRKYDRIINVSMDENQTISSYIEKVEGGYYCAPKAVRKRDREQAKTVANIFLETAFLCREYDIPVRTYVEISKVNDEYHIIHFANKTKIKNGEYTWKYSFKS